LALMACDDNCGQQLTEACKLAGIKIPEEVAVLGVDNDELICSLSDPALSSIHLDAETGGYLAAQLMERLIGNPSLKYNVLIEPTRIITRQSTDIYATADKHIAMALKFIHQNIYNALTVNDIVREIPLSRRAFEMKFKKATNQSVYQYILNLRAASFAEQLCQTEMPVLDIAQGMGMPDSGNFGRRFKQIMGSSPNAYRKQNKK
jgi:LacI family transcriptional regulator